MKTDDERFWAQVDAQCDRFERARREDSDTSIAEFLIGDWPSDHRRILLRELLGVELEYLDAVENDRPVEYYAKQLPKYRDVVEECFANRSQHVTRPLSESGRLPARSDGSPSPSVEFRRDTAQRSVGDYDIIEEIARGGMGVVYRARHRQLDRIVALKVILSGDLASTEEIERFQAEARAAAQLDHSHIVPVFDVGNADGKHYLSMGFVEGEDLVDAVSRNLFEPRPAAELIHKLALAIDYAHRSGILHRDLKPANVLIDSEGEPRLTDFGLAKMLNVEGASDLTRTGQLLGTPTYMAPEQARGDFAQLGPSSDIYSLGAILYFCLTGRPPFRAATVVETLRQVLQDDPVSPRTINAQVDRDLETICLKCLSKDPKQRYRSCAALGDDLQRYLDGRPIQARPIGLFSRAVRWCNRHRTRAALLATAALLVLVTIGSGRGKSIAFWEDRWDLGMEMRTTTLMPAKTEPAHFGVYRTRSFVSPVHHARNRPCLPLRSVFLSRSVAISIARRS